MSELPADVDDYKEIFKTHIELCHELHENSNLIPEKLWEKIEDLVYRHYEP